MLAPYGTRFTTFFVTSKDGELDVWHGPSNHSAHNIVLQVLATTGLIGVLLFAWGLARPLTAAWQGLRHDSNAGRLPVFLVLVGLWYLVWGQLCESFMGPIQPESVALLKDEITRADAVLFATPEYNASVPGSLKNALDWISRPFADNPLREKRVAVIGASQGAFGAAWAQAELRKVLQTLGASVEQRELAVAHAQHAFAADGLLRDREQRAVLTSIIETLRGQRRARRAA